MSKEIQVVYIITKLELGGAQKVCLSLFNGIPLSTLISGSHGTLASQVTAKENTILLSSITREISFLSLFKELRCFIEIVRHLRRLKKNYPSIIVHTHSTKAGLIGRWAAWCAGIATRVHTVHGYGFHNHQKRLIWFGIYFLELITSFITTHYVCVSSEDVKTGVKLFPWFSKKHSIIRAAVDKKFYIPARPINSKKTQLIFGSIACFKPQKNIFDLLRAFKKVHDQEPRARLELIGDGELRPAIEQWITTHQLSAVITLHGWQSNVVPIMRQWNAFVLSSLWEGLPCAIVEARLLKLPVISYDTGGIHDVIEHQQNGLLYKKQDWEGLASGMLLVIRDAPLYQKLQMYSDDLHEFKTDYMIKKHIMLYKQLAR